MNNGVVIALIAYASFSLGDAVVKALGGRLSVFEIGFYSTLFAGIALLGFRPAGERWRDAWRTGRPWAVHGRALAGSIATALGVYAFTTIPLAEVYALIFLAPLMVTLLSIVVLGETVGRWRWFAVVAGFFGVMLVVQPGFRALQLGHLAAFLVAFLAALSVVLMRALATERRTTMLAYTIGYGIVLNALAMLATAPLAPPGGAEFGLLVLAGAFAAGGQLGILLATRYAPASHLASTHYSQIAWAVVLGAALFAEYPDAWSLVGLGVLAGCGLLTMMREQARLGVVRWNPFSRTRL